MKPLPISEDDLHAWADGRLDASRHADLEAWLAEHPGERARLEAWQAQNRLLHEQFDRLLHAPVPTRLADMAVPRTRSPWRMAASVAWLALGGLIGFVLRGSFVSQGMAPEAALPHQAAIAHAVFSPEVRHPVEVTADQESHLVAWLSKRLGASLKVPDLNDAGFTLVGGRLLPGDSGPVAKFMYQDAGGRRLTLYVRALQGEKETAFRYAREGGIGVFYWLDERLGYAISGELAQPELLKLATLVYRQLNPM
jgi:anti-sigma factor RsiW